MLQYFSWNLHPGLGSKADLATFISNLAQRDIMSTDYCIVLRHPSVGFKNEHKRHLTGFLFSMKCYTCELSATSHVATIRHITIKLLTYLILQLPFYE